MLSFDLEKKDFVKLARRLKKPGFIQLLANPKSKCSPLGLYRRLQKTKSKTCNCSYLLESVEKAESKARYSFVGNEADAVLSIKGKELSLTYLAQERELFEVLCRGIEKCCKLEAKIESKNPKDLKNPLQLRASILPGKDGFDTLRSAFPPANGAALLNGKRFSRQTFLGGAIGFTAYDSVYECFLKQKASLESELPDHQFLLVSKTFLFDHLKKEVYLVLTPFVNPESDSDPETLYEKALLEAERLSLLLKEAEEFEQEGEKGKEKRKNKREKQTQAIKYLQDRDKKAFEAAVLAAKQQILKGNIFQVVLSRSQTFGTQKSAFELYLRLRAINPSPYMYLFEFGKLALVGASPETLLAIHRRTLSINPIAGTCPRGRTKAEDEALAARLLEDEKEKAEHVMLVDLGRNDVRSVSKRGSVKVKDFMKVLKYSHVQHLESSIKGKLRPECDQFDAFRASFPAGTLSGAPKLRAMEIIATLETAPRGTYGGGAGYYSWNGDADFAILIRTLLLKDGLVFVQAGAGIVADSLPEKEFLETEAKMGALIKAVGKKAESENQIKEG